MEIERKYLISRIPDNLDIQSRHMLEQGYLNTDPVIRIRKDNDSYELTYKSTGLMVREEYNLPLTKEAYEHLKLKIDGRMIKKTRLVIPHGNGLFIELDIFQEDLAPLMTAEVEFPTEEAANVFVPPSWFGEEVTFVPEYKNSELSNKVDKSTSTP